MQQDRQAFLEVRAEVQGGEGSLAHDHGMHELYGDVLRIRRGRTAPERQQTAAVQEALGHLAARFGQARRLGLEERLEDGVSSEKLFSAPGD